MKIIKQSDSIHVAVHGFDEDHELSFDDLPNYAFPDFDDQVKLEEDNWRVDDPEDNKHTEDYGKISYTKKDLAGIRHKIVYHGNRFGNRAESRWSHTNSILDTGQQGNYTEHDDLDSALEKAQQVGRPQFSHGEHGLRRNPGSGNNSEYHVRVKKFPIDPGDVMKRVNKA